MTVEVIATGEFDGWMATLTPRELRPRRGASPLRPVYAFDPRRQAVLLTGGDKGADKAMYDRIIPRAEAIWEQYLRERT
jgi:hypothetical protein